MALVAVSVVLFVVPQNYVDLDPLWRVSVQILTVAGGATGLLLLAFNYPTVLPPVAAVFCLLAIAAQLSSGHGATALYILCPAIVGVAVGCFVSQSNGLIRLHILFLGILTLSLVVDVLAGAPATASVFGEVNRITSLTGTRARGVMGQPVPAAMATVLVVTALLILARRIEAQGRRTLACAALAATVVAALIVTGTRSAIAVMIVGAVSVFILTPRRAKRRHNKLISLSGFLALVGSAIMLAPAADRTLGGLRVFSFEGIRLSESSLNRLHALTILDNWQGDCGLVCKAIGSGPRALQRELQEFLGLNGLSTVDNVYVTTLWDYGVIGLTVVASLFILAVRPLFRLDRSFNESAAAGGLIAFLCAGFFFDAIYTTPILMLGSLYVGVLLCSSRMPSEGTTAR